MTEATRYKTGMTYPAITAFYAALLALIYVGLSAFVVLGRLRFNALHGDSAGALTKRIRIHANFMEYVPLALILVALLEAGGGSPTLVRTLLILLVVARLAHPFGMVAPVNSPQQFACRGGGTILTFGVVIIAAVDLLLR